MFDKLRHFLAEVSTVEPKRKFGREFGDDDYRLAAVALLVHLAEADGAVGKAEKGRLRQIIESNFGLDEKTAGRLIASAEQSDHEAVDFYHFTHVIKNALDEEGRLRLIEMMWELAFADGRVDELEDNIVWRVAELLGVSGRDRVMLRQRVAAEPQRETAEEADFAGPWSELKR